MKKPLVSLRVGYISRHVKEAEGKHATLMIFRLTQEEILT